MDSRRGTYRADATPRGRPSTASFCWVTSWTCSASVGIAHATGWWRHGVLHVPPRTRGPEVSSGRLCGVASGTVTSVGPLAEVVVAAGAVVGPPATLAAVDLLSMAIEPGDLVPAAAHFRDLRRVERHGLLRGSMPRTKAPRWTAALRDSGNGAPSGPSEAPNLLVRAGWQLPEEGPACAVLGRSHAERELAAVGALCYP